MQLLYPVPLSPISGELLSMGLGPGRTPQYLVRPLVYSHVLSNGCIADGVGSGRDAVLAAVAATTAVQAGHVHAVEAVMRLPWAWSCLVVPVLIRASVKGHTGRGIRFPGASSLLVWNEQTPAMGLCAWCPSLPQEPWRSHRLRPSHAVWLPGA